MDNILKIEDIVKILDVDPDAVFSLLNSGELRGFKIGSKWRVRRSDLTLFLEHKVESQRAHSVFQALNDPKKWAKLLSEYPDLRRQIENTNYADGTFGAFLKKGLKIQESEL